MKDIRLIISDLDGTILNDQKWINDYSVSVLQQARSKGIRICFASGRHEEMMSLYVSLVGGVDYLISSNGAMVKETKTQQLIRCDVLPEDTVIKLTEFLRAREISFVLYSQDCAFYSQPHMNITKRMEKYEELARKAGIAVTVPREQINFECLEVYVKNIVKLMVYEDRQEYMETVKSYLAEWEDICREYTEKSLLGIFKSQVSKKTAIEAIMEQLKIGKEQVVVFGDYENDLSMFECTDNRVAMENAVEALKEQAAFVTASNNEDGVARFIDRMILKTGMGGGTDKFRAI